MILGYDVSGLANVNSGSGRYTHRLLVRLAELAGTESLKIRAFYGSWRQIPEVQAITGELHLRTRRLVVPSRLHRVWWHRLGIPPLTWVAGPMDVVHANDWLNPPFFGRRTLNTVFDLAALRHSEWYPEDIRAAIVERVRVLSRRDGWIVATSEATRQDVLEFVHAPPERVVRIYLGTDHLEECAPQRLAPIVGSAPWRKPYILYVGTFEPRKNLSRLIQAYARLGDDFARDVDLLIVGRNSGGAWNQDPTAAIAEIATQHLTGRVHLLEARSDSALSEFYRHATVFTFPTLYEGFGIPVSEAMRCGVPVVAANTSSLPEIVDDAGILVDPYDVEAIADGIRRILNDRSLAETLGRRGRERMQSWTWERAAREHCAVYRQIAEAV
jgi:glycosyltransferase involved in cell wall biosynthesis